MPKWSEYLAIARERGSLALDLYCAVWTPCAAPERLREVLPVHLAYIAELESAGALAFAGPLSDETGENMEGMGMVVFRAESFEAARAVVENDPNNREGVKTCVLRRWMINEGTFQLSVTLGARGVTLA